MLFKGSSIHTLPLLSRYLVLRLFIYRHTILDTNKTMTSFIDDPKLSHFCFDFQSWSVEQNFTWLQSLTSDSSLSVRSSACHFELQIRPWDGLNFHNVNAQLWRRIGAGNMSINRSTAKFDYIEHRRTVIICLLYLKTQWNSLCLPEPVISKRFCGLSALKPSSNTSLYRGRHHGSVADLERLSSEIKTFIIF